MTSLFNLLGVAFWLASLVSCSASKSAMQETNGLLLLLIGTVFVSTAAIVGEIRSQRAKAGIGDTEPGDAKKPATQKFEIPDFIKK